MERFDTFGLAPALLQAINDLGFEEPTPIQSAAIRPLLSGRDVIGRARTGSGKTAAFGLPLLQRVQSGGPVRALVLAPTRELAIQVAKAIEALAKHMKVRVLTIYGGASYRPQLRGLQQGSTIVVGTPGRVIDLMERGALDLSGVEYFVLDEADEMLRMGFIEDVEKVLAQLPGQRQVALFSATMPDEIRRVAENYLQSPAEIEVEGEELSVDHIDQRFIRVSHRQKERALLRLFAGTQTDGTLVFARTRVRCAEAAAMLIANGISADALHGDLNQGARERVLGRLRAKALDVVVATDVAARGLDVNHLTHVINYDIPDDAETYTHRIGRTARAGREGTAITLVTPRERGRIRKFSRDLGIDPIWINLPTNDEIDASRQDELTDLIKKTLADPDVVKVRDWLRGQLDKNGWSAEDAASAALLLLRRERNFSFEDEEIQTGAAVGDGASTSHDVKDHINESEIVISLGRKDGIRPADIVGTFTNELGIPANQIGRIKLGARRVFVGLPKKVADLMIRDHSDIELRGKSARVQPNGSAGPGGSGRSGSSRRKSGRRKGRNGGRKRGGKK